MNTKEILDFVVMRNEILSKIENYIAEYDLSEDEVSDVLAEITEKINELGPAECVRKETTAIMSSMN